MQDELVSNASSKDSTKLDAERLVKQYRNLARELQLPENDLSFYDACFITPLLKAPKEGKSLLSVSTLCGCLEEHRYRTLQVLELCERRDNLIEWMLTCCERFEWSAIRHHSLRVVNQEVLPIDDSERYFFRFFPCALVAHQRITEQLVGAIFRWREQLTRPYAFNVWNENYIFRIVEDCELLDASALGKALGLKLSEHPLADTRLGAPAPYRNTGGHDCFMMPGGVYEQRLLAADLRDCADALVAVSEYWHPYAIRCRRRSTAGGTGEDRGDRVLGEAIIKGEHQLQGMLLEELKALTENNRFLPILSTPTLVLLSESGLPLTESFPQEWLQFIVPAGAGSLATYHPHSEEDSSASAGRSGSSQSASDSSGNPAPTTTEGSLTSGSVPSSSNTSFVIQKSWSPDRYDPAAT